MTKAEQEQNRREREALEKRMNDKMDRERETAKEQTKLSSEANGEEKKHIWEAIKEKK